VKLKVAGNEVTSAGEKAINGLKTNNTFKNVGVSLRDDQVPIDVLAAASKRLTELTGEQVLALEPNICKSASQFFPSCQKDYASLEFQLSNLGLSGSERINSLNIDLEQLLLTDASEAPRKLGAETSELYEILKWAQEAKRALNQGLTTTLQELKQYVDGINSLPAMGILGSLQEDLAEEISQFKERLQQNDFYNHVTDFSNNLTLIKNSVRDATIELETTQQQRIKESKQDLTRLTEWKELTQEMQNNVLASLEQLTVEVSHDMTGIQTLISQRFIVDDTLSDLKTRVQQDGQARRLKRLEEEKATSEEAGQTKLNCNITKTVNSENELGELVSEINEIKDKIELYNEVEGNINVNIDIKKKH